MAFDGSPRVKAGGFSLDFGGGEPPDAEERSFLETLETRGECEQSPVLRVRLSSLRLWPLATERDARSGEPAIYMRDGDELLVAHEAFEASINPRRGSVELFRSPEVGAAALRAVLRMALGACLPRNEGLGFHAAGLVLRCGGVAFFGVSGAGKSTLALVSDRPVLSDEFVAVLPNETRSGFLIAPTGTWSTFGECRSAGTTSLRALVALEKTPFFHWEQLDPHRALRRLIPVLAVPPGPGFIETCLPLLGQLVKRVPVFRMGWCLEDPPVQRVESLLRPGSLPG